MKKYVPTLDTETLFHYDLAASPHLAARVSKKVSETTHPTPYPRILHGSNI